MTLQIIGAGFGRTGTDSLRHALNLLGVGPCHHMHEVMPSDAQRDLWQRKSVGENPPWPEMFKGFNCAVDWPSAHFWEELMEVYPEAKVIMTYRDPESWWSSFEKTILPVLMRMRDEGGSMAWRIIGEGKFEGRPEDRDLVLDLYNANIARAREIVPADRYLEMQLGEGWDRLCGFLGLDVPDTVYPSGNTTAIFRKNLGLD